MQIHYSSLLKNATRMDLNVLSTQPHSTTSIKPIRPNASMNQTIRHTSLPTQLVKLTDTISTLNVWRIITASYPVQTSMLFNMYSQYSITIVVWLLLGILEHMIRLPLNWQTILQRSMISDSGSSLLMEKEFHPRSRIKNQIYPRYPACLGIESWTERSGVKLPSETQE